MLFLFWLNQTFKFLNLKNIIVLSSLIIGVLLSIINFLDSTIISYKLADISSNKRWENYLFYINNFLKNFEIYKDGVISATGIIHNQFLTLIPRFGFIGFLISISILILYFSNIIKAMKKQIHIYF